jgi:hypothetical protein
MGKFDDFWNESDEDFFKSSREKIANLPPPGPDTRSQADKDRDAAFKAESDEWARSRAEHTKLQQDAWIRAQQRRGTSKPRGSN